MRDKSHDRRVTKQLFVVTSFEMAGIAGIQLQMIETHDSIRLSPY